MVSEILAKRDFFLSMKDARIFWITKNRERFWGCEESSKGFFGVCYKKCIKII